jgi:glycerophosphoryl diester phosphodiesterase
MKRVEIKKGFLDSIFDWWKRLWEEPTFTKPVDEFYIVGHRGACAYEIENTISSFQKALNLGANALEMDLCLTRDEQIILWHDWDPDDSIALPRQMGLEPITKYIPRIPDIGSEYRKKISKLTREEHLRTHGWKSRDGYSLDEYKINTLSEMFEWAKDKQQLKLVFFDIKCPSDELYSAKIMAIKISNFVKMYKPHYKVVLMCPREDVLREMKIFYSDAECTRDVELPLGVVFDYDKYSAIIKAKQFGYKWASIGRAVVGQLAPWETYKEIIENDVKKKDGTNIKLVGWTIKDKKEMEYLIKMGIDGLVVDYPDVLSKVLSKVKQS